MNFTVVSGTGNLFALFDGIAGGIPEDPRLVALELCAAALGRIATVRTAVDPATRLDGVLLLLPGREGAACRMVVYNADGSRPETCGNGLRVVAMAARGSGHAAADEFTIETDAGPRAARVLRADPADPNSAIVGAEIAMGEPRVGERRVTLKTDFGAVEATLVDLGNPHCVVFVRDERETPVEKLGPALERHRHFPARTNVEFVSVRPEGLHMRVWERGVGETAACGTGACAAAIAAAVTQRAGTPVDVHVPGGLLHVAWEGGGEVRLSGSCETLGTAEWRAAKRTHRP